LENIEMTTIVDPGGSPSVIYSSDATTIASVTSAGTTQGNATQLVKYSAWNVVLVTSGGGTSGVKLPSNADIGDVFEVHNAASGFGGKLYPESGAEINNLGTNEYASLDVVVRKVSSGNWKIVSTNPF
jgi:hypothetical protein